MICERVKGYWKFYNSLLKDHNFLQTVNDTMPDVKQTYAANDNDDYLDTQETELSINDQLFLETLLLMLRGNAIKYSSF